LLLLLIIIILHSAATHKSNTIAITIFYDFLFIIIFCKTVQPFSMSVLSIHDIDP